MTTQEDVDLIWKPNARVPAIEAPGRVPAKDVLALVSDPSPVVRRLAQEVLSHRWEECEKLQGSE